MKLDKNEIKRKASLIIFDFLKEKSGGNTDWFHYNRQMIIDECEITYHYFNEGLRILKENGHIEVRYNGIPRRLEYKILK